MKLKLNSVGSLTIPAVLLIILVVFLSSWSKVAPGEVGVIVSTMGSDKGVDMKPAKSGWNFIWPTEDLYTFKTWDQNINLTEISFGDSDGARITAMVGVTASAEADSAPKLFLKYRKDMEDIIKTNGVQVIKTAFTNEASKLKVDSIYGEGQEEFLSRVRDRVAEHFSKYGLKVSNLYLLEELGLPPAIKDALNSKVLANQLTAQKQNEVAQATADANKIREAAYGERDAAIARAEGQAQAITKLGEAMVKNPLYLELRKIETWKGDVPGTLVTNGSTPTFLPIK